MVVLSHSVQLLAELLICLALLKEVVFGLLRGPLCLEPMVIILLLCSLLLELIGLFLPWRIVWCRRHTFLPFNRKDVAASAAVTYINERKQRLRNTLCLLQLWSFYRGWATNERPAILCKPGLTIGLIRYKR